MLISRKGYKMEIYFQWKTNRKSYVAYRIAPVLMTLKNDTEGHSPVAGLFKCNPSNICAVFYQISTDSVLARSLSDSWASCTTCCSLRFPRWSSWSKMRSSSGWVSRSWLWRRIFSDDLTFYRNSSIPCIWCISIIKLANKEHGTLISLLGRIV